MVDGVIGGFSAFTGLIGRARGASVGRFSPRLTGAGASLEAPANLEANATRARCSPRQVCYSCYTCYSWERPLAASRIRHMLTLTGYTQRSR